MIAMAKYIHRDELVEWLKRIPLKDLSDGLGLCRVIMEEDFKRAIRTIPDGIIVDLEPVVRCRDCKYYRVSTMLAPNKFCFRLKHPVEDRPIGYNFAPDDFCSYGEREEND